MNQTDRVSSWCERKGVRFTERFGISKIPPNKRERADGAIPTQVSRIAQLLVIQ